MYALLSRPVILDGFLKNPSFEKAMSGRAGFGLWASCFRRRPRFTFWLIFFQRYMLPFFFSGLLSYLVGLKRRNSRRAACKRENALSSLCIHLP